MSQDGSELSAVIPPKPGDYLPSAIKKAVISVGAKHPVTVYPIALGFSCAFIGWLFAIPLLIKIGIAGLILGPAYALGAIFIFNKKTSSQYVNLMNKRQKEYERYIKILIKKGLQETKSIPGAEQFAIQGTKQFDDTEEKYQNVKELLDIKLKDTELTYGRFLGAAEQVSLSVLDNLKNVISLIKSAGSIHPDYINKQIKAITSNETMTKEDENQIVTLKQRLDLHGQQFGKVKQLLAKNEEAMTEMEKISAAIADWNTDSKFADTDFENAITRLHELAEQAHIYEN